MAAVRVVAAWLLFAAAALEVDATPIEGFDHRAEMRKMRLLLESLL